MEIKKYSPQSHKIKALVYGKPGCGKTTFGGTAPKPLFLSAEGGLLSIASLQPEAVDIKSLKDLNDALDYLKTQKHDYQTVIIDSITEINEVIKSEIEKRTGHSRKLNDWGEVQSKIKAVIRGFRDLPMHVLFLALENIDKDEDRVQTITPSLNGKSATDIASFMDIVGYLYLDKSTGERKVTTKTSNVLLTKDRTNALPAEPTLNFNDWVDAVSKIEISESQKLVEHEKPDENAKPKFGQDNFDKIVVLVADGKAPTIEQIKSKYDLDIEWESKIQSLLNPIDESEPTDLIAEIANATNSK